MRAFMISALLLLSACSDFTPASKEPVYNPTTRTVDVPARCPDWSHSASNNYDNSVHSNYGCAVGNNMAVQLADPADWQRGHGAQGPDTHTTTRVIERYRAGEIPEPLVPQQTSGGE